MLGHHIVDPGLNLIDFVSFIPALIDLFVLPTICFPLPLLHILLLLRLHLLHPLLLVVHHEGVDGEHLVEDWQCLLLIHGTRRSEEKLLAQASYLYGDSIIGVVMIRW